MAVPATRDTSAAIRELVRTSMNSSRYSHINWKIETKSKILSGISSFSWPPIFRAVEIPRSNEVIQLNLYTDRFFKPVDSDLGEKGELELEKPATLIVNIHPSGTIVFHASGCSTSHASTDSDGFILAFFQNAQDLGGAHGTYLIQKTLIRFSKLAAVSLTDHAATKSSGRFLEVLQRRSDRFRFLYATPADAKRARISQYTGFAGGLAGGLISSSVFPMAATVGERLQTSGKAVPIFFQADFLLLTSLCITAVALYVIYKAMKQR